MTLLALNVAQLEQGLRDSMIFIKAMELFLPSWFYPLGILAVLAIIMSTLDSFSFVTGQSLMNDGIMRLFPEFTGRRPRLFSRIGVLLIFLIAVPIALIRPELTTLMYLAIYLFTCMMPIFFALMKNPPGGTGVFIAILAALIANVGLFYAGLLSNWISIGIMAVAMVYPFLHDRVVMLIAQRKKTIA
jgi:Na+/proline symporter